MTHVGLVEALIASSEGKTVVSETTEDGYYYVLHPQALNAKRLSDTAATCSGGMLPRNAQNLRWGIQP